MDFNITFNRKIVNKIKIGIFTFYLENGGRSRITSFLLNYLNKVNFFNLYLFTNKNKGKTEYFINENIKRILINDFNITVLIKNIIKKRINMFIYQFSDSSSIKLLNGLSNTIYSMVIWLYNLLKLYIININLSFFGFIRIIHNLNLFTKYIKRQNI